jgi:ribonuclease E
MKEAKHKADVERALKNNLKDDKAKTKIGKISRFGLLEMSRQRIRPSIEYGNYEPCRFCRGKGLIPSVETLGRGFLRKLRVEILKDEITGIKGIGISIEGNISMIPVESQIIPQKQ